MRKALVLAVALVGLANAAAQACTLVKVAEWPVRLQHGLPIVSGSINGKDARILIDTGADLSLLYLPGAVRLGIAARATDGSVFGVGGETRMGLATLDEFRLGKAVRRDWTVAVAGDHPRLPFDFILGDDFLENVDLELDYPNGAVRLFQPQGCGERNLAYWDAPNAIAVPIRPGRRIFFEARLNGERISAMLDTGASLSIVSDTAARHVGVTREAPGVREMGCTVGLGRKTTEVWRVPFKSLAIGAQTIHDPELDIGRIHKHAKLTATGSRLAVPPDAQADMIVGSDFLRAHRVLIARSQGRIYFTHAGGRVFPAGMKANCAAAAAGPYEAELRAARARGDKAAIARSVEHIAQIVPVDPADAASLAERAHMWSLNEEFDRALADYDAALTLQPREAGYLAGRGYALAKKGEAARALADFDAAIALDPDFVEARWERSVLRMNAKQYDAALADIEAVLKANPRGVGAHLNKASIHLHRDEADRALEHVDEALRLRPDFVAAISFRGDIWAHRGDDPRALAEWDRAQKADPKAPLNLRRGRAYFRMGRFDESAREFAGATAGTSSVHAYNPIWRYLAAARSGRDERQVLGAEAGTMTGWPQRIARFHLGEIDESALLSAAASPDSMRRREQECEAHFNIAQRWLIQRQPERARPWLERARDGCPRNYSEYLGAVAELRRLS